MCGVGACGSQESMWCVSLWQVEVCVVCELVACRTMCGV